MEGVFERLLLAPMNVFFEKVMQFLPNLFSALFIFVCGLLVGWLAKTVLRWLFAVLKLDGFADRLGVTRGLAKGGLHDSFSSVLARFIGGFVVFVFFLVSLNNLNVDLIQTMIEKFLNYLPNVFVAIVILSLGYMLGTFLGRTVLIASVNAGMRISGLVGRFVKYLVFLLAVAIAVDQLGIGAEAVLVTYTIVFSGVVLALAIAFGLGGKDTARKYLEGKLKEKKGGEGEDVMRHL